MNNKKQKIIPALRFSEFESDGEWEVKTINDIKAIVTDYVANGSFASLKENVEVQNLKNFAFYVRLTDLRIGLGHRTQKFVTKKSYDFLNKSCLFGGEILMANIGANVGEIWQMPKVNYPATLAPNMIMAKFKENIENEFIFYFLNSEVGKINISTTISGNAHPKINKTEFKQVNVILPSNIKEQKKIACCLSSLDSVIESATEKLKLLKNHKKGLLQQLFPAEGETKPQFRFSEFENDGEWEEKELGDCLDYLQPTKYLVESTDYDKTYPTPVLTAGKTFVLGYTNEKEGIFNKKLPIIIFDDFTTASKFVDFPFKAKSSAMKILLAKNNTNIKFIYESMQIMRFEVGVHKRHWISIFSKLKIAVPKPKEQQKIANCLSSVDNLITSQTKKIKALKAHKKGLMQQLFPSTTA